MVRILRRHWRIRLHRLGSRTTLDGLLSVFPGGAGWGTPLTITAEQAPPTWHTIGSGGVASW